MNCSTPGFPVLHHLLEFVQTHLHWVGDAIQLPCPVSSPSLPAFNLSQWALCIWCPKYWSFNFSISPSNQSLQVRFPLGLTSLISLLSRDSQESSPAPQFKGISSSALSLFYCPALTSIHDYWKNHCCLCMDFVGKVMSLLFNMLSKLVTVFLPRSKLLFFFNKINLFIYFNWRLITLEYIVVVFAIHWHKSATGVCGFPILNAPPISLPIPSLWVVPVHQL